MTHTNAKCWGIIWGGMACVWFALTLYCAVLLAEIGKPDGCNYWFVSDWMNVFVWPFVFLSMYQVPRPFSRADYLLILAEISSRRFFCGMLRGGASQFFWQNITMDIWQSPWNLTLVIIAGLMIPGISQSYWYSGYGNYIDSLVKVLTERSIQVYLSNIANEFTSFFRFLATMFWVLVHVSIVKYVLYPSSWIFTYSLYCIALMGIISLLCIRFILYYSVYCTHGMSKDPGSGDRFSFWWQQQRHRVYRIAVVLMVMILLHV